MILKSEMNAKNSTIKVAAKDAEELTNQLRTVTKKKGGHATHKSTIRRVLKEKRGKAK